MATTTPADAVAAATAPPDEASEANPRRWLALVVLCTSVLVLAIDNTILNVALPSIGQDLGATTSQLQWIVDAYILVFAGLLLTGGALGDRFGRKGALLVGLVVFGAGSLAASVAGSPEAVMISRGVMGVGGALVMPATLSLLTSLFPDPKERAKAIAAWAGTFGIGIAIGPLAGGWLLEHFWWGSAFLVNAPVIVLAFVGTALLVPSSRDRHAARLDPVGALLSTAGLATLVWAIIEAPEHGWTGTLTLVGFAAALALLGGFVAWEHRRDEPMLDMAFFGNARFSAASVAVTITFFALVGGTFLLTQHLQLVLGYDALQAGMRITPIAVPIIGLAPISTKLVERIGTKVVVATGLATVALGLAVAASITPTDGYAKVLVAILVIGSGMGLAMGPATESIMGSIPVDKAGVGSAVNDTTREVGSALGVAVIGSVASSAYGSSMADTVAASPVPVPAEAADAIQDSIVGALAVADQVGGAVGQGLADAAKVAFVDGMGNGLTVGAAMAFAGAVIALVFLPSRAKEQAEEAEREDEVDLDLAPEPELVAA
jgi:EmrB/QacA subfamily drug resistance transporter